MEGLGYGNIMLAASKGPQGKTPGKLHSSSQNQWVELADATATSTLGIVFADDTFLVRLRIDNQIADQSNKIMLCDIGEYNREKQHCDQSIT